jgi:hypothetical protein
MKKQRKHHTIPPKACYKFHMSPKTSRRWVLYERREGKFLHLSKLFKTRKQAEQERLKLSARPEYARSSIGVGFIRIRR